MLTTRRHFAEQATEIFGVSFLKAVLGKTLDKFYQRTSRTILPMYSFFPKASWAAAISRSG